MNAKDVILFATTRAATLRIDAQRYRDSPLVPTHAADIAARDKFVAALEECAAIMDDCATDIREGSS